MNYTYFSIAYATISDVRKTLEDQYDDIVALRTQMLNEYEQLLSVRTEVMASQTEEVEKLQEEMASIQRQYEEQMSTFQAKVEEQSGMMVVVVVCVCVGGGVGGRGWRGSCLSWLRSTSVIMHQSFVTTAFQSPQLRGRVGESGEQSLSVWQLVFDCPPHSRENDVLTLGAFDLQYFLQWRAGPSAEVYSSETEDIIPAMFHRRV